MASLEPRAMARAGLRALNSAVTPPTPNADLGQVSRRLRVLVVSSWYPSRVDPVSGIFVRDFVDALRSRHEVRVLAPQIVSLRQGFRRRSISSPDPTEDDVLRPIVPRVLPRRLDWRPTA